MLLPACQSGKQEDRSKHKAEATAELKQPVTPQAKDDQPSSDKVQDTIKQAMKQAGLDVQPIPEDRRWWEPDDKACPDGASLRGATPPEGTMIWCQLPDGNKHGRATRFTRFGHIIADGMHVQGKKHGTFMSYYKSGEKKLQVEFVDGKENGPMTGWHRNGQKALVGTYKDGKGFGPWTKWDETGKQVAEGTY